MASVHASGAEAARSDAVRSDAVRSDAVRSDAVIRPDYPEPLWLQAVDSILRDVADGVLRSGMRLPPERELCQRLNISRVTLRKALLTLVDSGVLKPSHGRGWYVAAAAAQNSATVQKDWPNSLESFSETAARMGLTASSTVLRQESSPATLDEAEQLAVAPGTGTFHLIRVRLLNGVPIAVDESTLATDRIPGIGQVDFEHASLYQQVIQAGIDLVRAESTIEAREADADTANRLGLAAGKPVLVMRQVALDTTDRPVFTSTITYHGERYRLRTSFARGIGGR